jgi:glucose-6-phosphate 1-dehydrogenase
MVLFLVFGATGDLTHRKIMPALYRMQSKKLLDNFACICVARKEKTDEEYRKDVKDSLKRYVKQMDEKIASSLLEKITYFRNDFDLAPNYGRLREVMEEVESRNRTTHRIFYLATLPEHFKPIVENLDRHGFVQRKKAETRIIIEKPFGSSLASAKDLNKILTKVFEEKEIFRIDHYLGKETVQNLFALRLGNRIFEPVWNTEHIENVQITVAESMGVEGRGNYYDKAGAIRDMVQNHILQTLSLVAMEPPKDFSTDAIKDSKVKLLKAIACPGKDCIKEDVVLGQYAKGSQGPGYIDEPGVMKGSKTETFAAMKITIPNKRWKGTPFFIRTGKMMKQKSSEITVYFRKTAGLKGFPEFKQNVLVIRLQPEEGIFMRFNIKEPGNEFKIQRVSMDFSHTSVFGINTPEAYEKLIYDAFHNDSTLFTRWDEVEASWKLIDPILEYHHLPLPYESGSWGPKKSIELVEREGFHWRLRDE